MNDWQKVENPVEGGVSGPDAETAPVVPASPSASPVPPHRPRKRRSDAGKKRALLSPEEETAVPETAAFPSAADPASEETAETAAMSRDGGDGPAARKNRGWSSVSAPRQKNVPQTDAAPQAAAKSAASTETADSPVPADPTDEPSGAGPAENSETFGWAVSEPEPVRSPARCTPSGRRRGLHRWAAPLGFLILLLAIIGLGSLAGLGIKAIQRSQDDTALRAELDDFLQPIMQYNPSAFEDVNATRQDALLLSAIWRLTDAERIRQLRENTDVCRYPMDDNARMLIPLEEINASYAYLYGPDAVPYHHTVGEEGMSFTFEYDPEQDCYHVPNTSSSSMYVPVLDKLKKKGDTVTVRVGYVLTTKIGIDEKGEQIEPTTADADHFQLYTVQQVGEDGWKLVSVADEKGSSAAATTPAAEISGDTTLSSETGTTAAATAGTTGSAAVSAG